MTTAIAKKYEHLNKYVKEIKSKYTGIRDKWTTSLDDAIRIGELLTQCKMKVEHGDWMDWEAEFLPFSDTTANKFIRAYGRREELRKLPAAGNLEDGWSDAVDKAGARSQRTPKAKAPKQLEQKKTEAVEVQESLIDSFNIKSLMKHMGPKKEMTPDVDPKELGREMTPVWNRIEDRVDVKLGEESISARLTDMLDKLPQSIDHYSRLEIYMKVKFVSEE